MSIEDDFRRTLKSLSGESSAWHVPNTFPWIKERFVWTADEVKNIQREARNTVLTTGLTKLKEELSKDPNLDLTLWTRRLVALTILAAAMDRAKG